MAYRDGLLPIQLEIDPTEAEVTAFEGLAPFLDAWNRLGMPTAVDALVGICGEQGWLDRQMVLSLILLNLVGGECVTDIDKLEHDAGEGVHTQCQRASVVSASRQQRVGS